MPGLRLKNATDLEHRYRRAWRRPATAGAATESSFGGGWRPDDEGYWFRRRRSRHRFATTLRAVLRFTCRQSRARCALLSWLLRAAAAAPPALAQSAAGALYGVVRGRPRRAARQGQRSPCAASRARRAPRTPTPAASSASSRSSPGSTTPQSTLADYSTAEYPDLPVHVGRSTTVDVILAPVRRAAPSRSPRSARCSTSGGSRPAPT